MKKTMWSGFFAAALVASTLAWAPAFAETQVPDEVNIKDIEGDANGLNDQGLGSTTGYQGDNPGGVNFVAADIQKVWFTNTAETISTHILTTAPGPNSRFGIIYRVMVNPGGSFPQGCVWFEGIVPSASYLGPQTARVLDQCQTAPAVEGTLTIEKVGEAGVTTLVLPRSALPAFADGAVLKAPVATTRTIHGGGPVPRTVTAPQLDNTKPGTDYTVTSGAEGGSTASPSPSPTASPGGSEPPGEKKGCKQKGKKGKKGKGKGKKKGCKKKGKKEPEPGPSAPPSPSPSPGEGPVAGCAPYQPGEKGAKAETAVVTDAATADKPIEVKITAPAGTGDVAVPGRTASVYYNVQVDSAAESAGLYVRYQFADRHDYDLYLYFADGKEAAHAAGFNPLPQGSPVPSGVLDGKGKGGHSETNAEQLDGIKTPDCMGYTIDLRSYLTTGGNNTLKLWLGDPTYEPKR